MISAALSSAKHVSQAHPLSYASEHILPLPVTNYTITQISAQHPPDFLENKEWLHFQPAAHRSIPHHGTEVLGKGEEDDADVEGAAGLLELPSVKPAEGCEAQIDAGVMHQIAWIFWRSMPCEILR